jgi:hypothetical protein
MRGHDAQKKLGADYDVVMVAGQTPDGAGAHVVRARPGRIEAGQVRPMKDGQPITGGEVVRLEQRADVPQLYDVKVEHAAEGAAKSEKPAAKPAALAEGRATRGGPAQVATDEYRTSWERTFGATKKMLN